MAIYRIAGQMLQSTLERDGNNLAFANTANTTSTLFIDIANSRVGINSNVANVTLDVAGNIAAESISLTGNVTVGNILIPAVGNINVGNVNISNLANPFANSDATTKFYVDSLVGNVSGILGNLTITDTTITPTGNLVIFSGNSGIVVPSGNTTTRPSPAQTGTLRVNTALSQIEAWDGTSWIGGGGTPSVTIIDQQITPDGINVVYTLDQESTNSSILVSINGVGQLPGNSYSVSGNSITFAQVPETTDIIDIRFLAYATEQNQILNSSGNTKIQTTDSSNIVFTVAGTSVATITTAGIFDISSGQSIKLPEYTVAQAANIVSPSTGLVIYCSNGDSGNPCLAVYSNSAWKRISFGANIST